jgi:hypothetical protein
MDKEYVTLKWGDIVRIHGVNLSKKKTTKGLLISKGYTIHLTNIDLQMLIYIIKHIINFHKLISIVNLCFKFYLELILICMINYLKF